MDQINTAFDDIMVDLDEEISLSKTDYHRWISKIKLDRDIERMFNKGSKAIKIRIANHLASTGKSVCEFLMQLLHSAMSQFNRNRKIRNIKLSKLVKSISSAFHGLNIKLKFEVDQYFEQIKRNIRATAHHYQNGLIQMHNTIQQQQFDIDEFKALKKENELLKAENQLLLEDNHQKQELVNTISKKITEIRGEAHIVTLENLDTHFEVLMSVQREHDQKVLEYQRIKSETLKEIDETMRLKLSAYEKLDELSKEYKKLSLNKDQISQDINFSKEERDNLAIELAELKSELKRSKANESSVVKKYEDNVLLSEVNFFKGHCRAMMPLIVEGTTPNPNSRHKNPKVREKQEYLSSQVSDFWFEIQDRYRNKQYDVLEKVLDHLSVQEVQFWCAFNKFRVEVYNPIKKRNVKIDNSLNEMQRRIKSKEYSVI